MAKTVLIVPRMYSREEFLKLAGYLPDDFKLKEDEFWSYVREKLLSSSQITRLYRDRICSSDLEGVEASHMVSEQEYQVIEALMRRGVKLQATEDPIEVAEAESWLGMLELNPNEEVADLYQASLKGRVRTMLRNVSESLGDGEVGALFIDPSLPFEAPNELAVYRVCRFEPQDYLNTSIVKWKLQRKGSRQ